MVLWAVAVLCLYAHALPTATSSPRATQSAGIQLPILTNANALHPRNKNLEGDALLQWMHREHGALHAKYTKQKQHGKKQARQLVGLGDFSQDSFYFTPIGIGNPSTSVNVLLDTGSSDFWIADASCTQQNGCSSGMTLYDPSKSSSFHGSDRQFMTPYGDGSNAVAGKLGADDVSMAGYLVKDLTFGRVHKLAGSTIQPPASGLMGLGFESLASSEGTPFWEVVAMQGKVKDPVFTFQLASTRAKDMGKKVVPGGIFSMGVLDHQQFSGDITWVKLAKGYGSRGVGYWAIVMDALEANGRRIPLGKMNTVAVDTGTTLIGAPRQVLEEIYSTIPGVRPAPTEVLGGSGYFMYPCRQRFEVTMTFGGRKFTLNNDNLNLGRYSSRSKMCISSLFQAPSEGQSSMPAWILGDTFLRTVFTAFQWNPERVGFASLPDRMQYMPLTSISSGESFDEPKTAGGSGENTEEPPPSTKTIDTQKTGLMGGEGLPTPSLASVPTGFKSLQSLKSYGLDNQARMHAPASLYLILGTALLATLAARTFT